MGPVLAPLVLFASLAIEVNQKLTHFDSGFLISRTFLLCAENSYTSLLCLYLVSCTQKKHQKVHSLTDAIPPFPTILKFSSEMSNNYWPALSMPFINLLHWTTE